MMSNYPTSIHLIRCWRHTLNYSRKHIAGIISGTNDMNMDTREKVYKKQISCMATSQWFYSHSLGPSVDMADSHTEDYEMWTV